MLSPETKSLITQVDLWLDSNCSTIYKDQPLAQDWARISKMSEELGEAVDAFILISGQNPRKGVSGTWQDVFDELADAVFTGIYAIQHFTKDIDHTERILEAHVAKMAYRIPSDDTAA